MTELLRPQTGARRVAPLPALRIGVLSPITHAFPPFGYGPWERVAHDLAEGLCLLGHKVTVFASEGSSTSADLVATCPAPLEGSGQDPRLAEELHIARAVEAAIDLSLEVLHSHLHVHALPYGRFLPMPLLSTLHGSAWNKAHHPALLHYRDQPFVSISDSERDFLPQLNYVGTVHNGIALEEIPFRSNKADYLVFVGRMAPEKAPDLAIEVARTVDMPLVLAGRVEDTHRAFYEERLAPNFDSQIEHAGELSRDETFDLMGRARGLLMPLRWDEPFGLVVAEALACGTPVLAWNRGAMPELITDGQTGFLVRSVKEAALAVPGLAGLDPAQCRSLAEARFSRQAMAEGYAACYAKLAATGDRPASRPV